MKEEFDKLLCEKYPKIFRDRHAPMTETCMCWGFEIGNGWYQIIDSLCGQIQHHVNWKQEQKEKYGRGEGCQQVVATQVKEKFGGLRFYYEGGDAVVDGMVRMAESWANHTCEECGKPGGMRHGGWIRTLCDEHEEERQAKYKERAGE
jgi:hypothetical protein